MTRARRSDAGTEDEFVVAVPAASTRRIGPYQESLIASRGEVATGPRRRRARRGRNRAVRGAAVAGILVVAAALGFRFLPDDLRDHLPGGASGTGHAGVAPIAQAQSLVDQGCARPTTLTVVVPDVMVAPFSEIVAAYQAQAQGPCATFTVVPRASAVVAQSLAGPERPDAWVTDAGFWLTQANSRAGLGLVADEPFASSPVVVAMQPDSASAAVDAGWAAIESAPSRFVLPNPQTSTVGLLALAGAADRWSPSQLREVAASSKALAPHSPALSLVADPERGTVAPVAAAELAEYNAANPSAPLGSVVPAEGAAPLEYSFVPVADGTVASRVLRGLKDYLGSDAARAVITRHGFDAPGAGSSPASDDSPAVDPLDVVRSEVLRQEWAALVPPPQAVLALDASATSLNRLDGRTILDRIATSAQIGVASMPDRSTLAVWAFAQHLGRKGEDHTVLADSAMLHGASHVQAIADGLASLPDHARGGRGLYDTIIAAHAAASARSTKGAPGTAVVVTTGPNDDDFGASLGAVKAALAQAPSSGAPARLVIIGVGPSPAAALMKEIVAVTGGAYLPVAKGEDLEQALTSALTGRR